MSIFASWHHRLTSDVLQRSSHTIGVVGGNAYIFGGELLPRQPRDNKVFQVGLKASDEDNVIELSPLSTAPSARVGSASATCNGKIYLFSGRGGEAMTPIEELGALWVFDPSDSTWSLLPPANPSDPFPQPRSYHCATSAGPNLIFVHAGCPISGRLSDLWSFDITARTWTQHADAPAPSRGGASITFTEGQLFRMNGFDGKKEQGAMIDVYNPETNIWDFRPFSADGVSGPAPRSVGALLPVSIDRESLLITCFGEGDPSALGHAGAGKMFDDVWAYHIKRDTWSKVDVNRDYGKAPRARGWYDAGAVDESTIVISGGLAENNERLGDCWLLSFQVGS